MRPVTLQFETKCNQLNADIYIQVSLRYIVGYTIGNHVLRSRSLVAVKHNFRPIYLPKRKL